MSPDALELGDAMRFTDGERKANTLQPDEEWVYYGCYRPL